MNAPTFSSGFLLNTSPQSIILNDTTPYVAQGIALSQVKGNFVLKSVGGIFHSNTNWATPDIVASTSLSYLTNAPLDQHGRVLNGQYTFTYTVEVTAEAFSLPIIGIDQSGQRFIVAGNQITNILNATNGDTFIIATGANAGTYAVVASTCSYDLVNNKTYIGVNSAIPSGSDISSPITFAANTTYSTTNTLNYCFLEPDVKIEAIDDCFKSTLVVSDLTKLNAIDCGVILTPQSINGTMIINYPINPSTGSPMASPITVSINNQNVSYTLNPICTGVFQIEYNVTVIYLLPDGSTLTVDLVGKKDHEVVCESGLCCASQCISNVYNNWLEARRTNPSQEKQWEDLLMKVMGAWMLYSINYECGNTSASQKYLAIIIELVKTNNCNCCPETSNAPTWVTAPISTSGTTSIVVAGTGIVVTPSGTNPITYTVSLNAGVVNGMIAAAMSSQKLFDHTDTAEIAPLINGQVLKYDSISGKWSNLLLSLSDLTNVSMSGVAQNYVLTMGAGGVASFAPSTFHNVIDNDIADVGTPASNTETVLKSFTIPAGTLVNNGDYVIIEAGLISSTANPLLPNTIKYYFGVTPTLRNTLTFSAVTFMSFEFKISRVNATTLFYELSEKIGNLPSSLVSNVWGTYAESAANPLIINFSGINGAAVANSIVAKFLRVCINHI